MLPLKLAIEYDPDPVHLFLLQTIASQFHVFPILITYVPKIHQVLFSHLSMLSQIAAFQAFPVIVFILSVFSLEFLVRHVIASLIVQLLGLTLGLPDDLCEQRSTSPYNILHPYVTYSVGVRTFPNALFSAVPI